MDTGKIERAAVRAVEYYIDSCPKLEPVIKMNDKSPFWDGDIYAYSDDRHLLKTYSARIPLLVKGTTNQNGSYRMVRDSVELIKADGGCVFFMVQVGEHSTLVFYAILSLTIIEELLKQTTRNIKIDLQVVPDDTHLFENEIFQFAKIREGEIVDSIEKKTSIKGAEVQSSPKFSSNSDYREIKSSYSDNVIDSIAAFLNGNGGEIYFFTDEQIEAIFNRIIQTLNQRLYPPKIFEDFIRFDIPKKVVIIKKGIIPFFVIENSNYYLYSRVNTKNVRQSYTEDEAKFEINNIIGIKTVIPDSNYFKYKYNLIGQFTMPERLYKYMSLETALLCIRGGTLRFSEPSSWADEREKTYYNMSIHNKIQSEVNPPILACCLSKKEYSEAAWKIYSYGKVGLDARCVEFTINTNYFINQLLETLNNNKKFKHYALYNGYITYNSDNLFKLLCSKGTYIYEEYFSNFSFDKYMSLLLLKHDAFEHEQESRFFLAPDDSIIDLIKKGNFDSKDIPINWSKVIEEIKIDAKCTKFEKQLFKEEFFSKGNAGKSIDDISKKQIKIIDYDVYAKSYPTPVVE